MLTFGACFLLFLRGLFLAFSDIPTFPTWVGCVISTSTVLIAQSEANSLRTTPPPLGLGWLAMVQLYNSCCRASSSFITWTTSQWMWLQPPVTCRTSQSPVSRGSDAYAGIKEFSLWMLRRQGLLAALGFWPFAMGFFLPLRIIRRLLFIPIQPTELERNREVLKLMSLIPCICWKLNVE